MEAGDPMDGGGGAPEAPASAAMPAERSTGNDVPDKNADIDALLSEFTSANKPNADPAAVPPQSPNTHWDKANAVTMDKWLELAMESDKNKLILEAFLRNHQQQADAQQERADFEEVLSEANDYLEGLPVAEDFAKRWLLAEVQLNPMLKEAWEYRRASPEHQAHAVKVIRRMFKDMRRSAEHTPDPVATEDRAAVTAAVRGASQMAPPAKAPNYSKMSSNELNAEWDRLLG